MSRSEIGRRSVSESGLGLELIVCFLHVVVGVGG